MNWKKATEAEKVDYILEEFKTFPEEYRANILFNGWNLVRRLNSSKWSHWWLPLFLIVVVHITVFALIILFCLDWL